MTPWHRAGAMRAMAVAAAALLLAACGPKHFEAQMELPPPLIVRIPVVAGLYIPQAFRDRVHQEERFGTQYQISIGKAQAAGFERLMQAMFERTVMLAGTDAASITDPAIRGVLEPVLEDFSFVTPRDAGSPFYAVSLRYRINLYARTGQLSDSWSFTGYGSVAASVMPMEGSKPLRAATALAMRDAGAKLAAEFIEQSIARGLLPAEAVREVTVPSAPAGSTGVEVEAAPGAASPPASSPSPTAAPAPTPPPSGA